MTATEPLSLKKVKVKICLCRGSETSGPYKGWNIQTYENFDHEIQINEKKSKTTVQNNFSSRFSVLVDTLERSRMDKNILKEHIEIFDIKLHDKDPSYMERVLEWLKQFDVVHILPGSLSKQAEESIYTAVHSLKQKTIIVSPCVATKQPPAPVDFPGHMVISVGCEKSKVENQTTVTDPDEETTLMTEMQNWQSCGSSLDFVCKGWKTLPAIEIKDPWEASYYAVGIAALVLVKAHAFGE